MRFEIFWQPSLRFFLCSAAIASNCMTIPSLSQNLKFNVYEDYHYDVLRLYKKSRIGHYFIQVIICYSIK